MKKSVFYKVLLVLAVGVAMAYLLVAVAVFAGRTDDVVCQRLELSFAASGENRLIDEADVVRLLKNGGLYPVGKKRSEVETEKIEARLSGSELIKSVECYLTPSGVARMYVKQRVPKFRVMGRQNYYVDTDRRVVRALAGYAAYLPVVSGDVPVEMAQGELFDFVDYLEKNDFWNAQVEQIFVRPDRKVELVPRVGGGIVLLGHLDGYEAKLEKLKKLYVNGFNEIGWNRYKMIDLQYKGQIVCTRAK